MKAAIIRLSYRTTGSARTPAIAALLSLVMLGGTYVQVAIATQLYAGVGETGLGLRSSPFHLRRTLRLA